ncbi:hypothetical protein BC827DRAFT_842578 [Russula dissimulans]|nr:hypothetical protein BC827DRAFT_842578 [Russula dissimulans]
MSSGSHRTRRNPSPKRGTSWEVIEIVEEDGKRYQVRWAGEDPRTGKPWPLDWVPSSYCSSELVKAWERKKAKEEVSLVPASISSSSLTSAARKRQSRKHNDAPSITEPPVRSTRKRKQPTRSVSTGSNDEGSPPLRRKRLSTNAEKAIGVDREELSTARHHTPDRTEHSTAGASPPHPPLEEIEVWVPTPGAKFGPPKRKRTKVEARDIPTVMTSVRAPSPLPLSPRPLILSESQIVALREEEEESQSQPQPTSNQSGNVARNTVPSDPPQTPAEDVRGITEVSTGDTLGPPERLISRPSINIQSTDSDTNKAQVLRPNTQGVHRQPNATNVSMQHEGVTETPKDFGPLLTPAAPHTSPVNLDSLNATALSSESPLMGKLANPGPSPIGKSGANTVEQPGSSKSDPSRSGNGTLAERRAFEARVRLDELRRAGASFRKVAEGRTSTLKTSQSPERRPAHIILKQVMGVMESPTQSQFTVPRRSGDEMLGVVSPSERRKVDPPHGSEDLAIQNKTGQDASHDSLPELDDVADVRLVRSDELSSEDEVPPTASSSARSRSQDASPQASLGNQLAAALDLLHRKSEEISELRARVNTLRRQTTDGEAKFVHTRADNGTSYDRGRADYFAASVQTDQDDEAQMVLHLERTLWSQEKVNLQAESERLRGEKARALADVDFFREQYQRASAFASSTRSENEELSARAAVAESQAVNGVALVRATFEARVTKLEAEVRKYKALSDMLTERARRTDDDVRYRAALAPELEREFNQLHRRNEETEAELEDTKDELRAKKRANARLRRRVASLEGKEQAESKMTPVQEPILWSDEKDDEDYNPDASPSSPLSLRDGHDGSSPQRQESQPHEEDDSRPADPGIEQMAFVGLEPSGQSSNDDMVYLCRWRPGDPAGDCDAILGSKQELHEHVASHHLSCH